MPQDTLDTLASIVEQTMDISPRIKKELDLLAEAPGFISEAFLKAYQAVHVNGQKPQGINECDSEIAYRLGITSKPPAVSFHYPVKPSALPDIDNDFADNHSVMDYAVQKYGADHVCKIGTMGRFKFKSLLKSLTTLFVDDEGERLIPLAEINALTKKLGMKIDSEIGDDDEDSESDKLDTSNEHILSFQREYPYVFEHFKALLGLPKYAGQHAAGILILPKPYRELFPIRKVKDKQDYATEWAEGQGVSELGAMGGIKIDLLGLMTLGVLEVANDLAVTRYGLNATTPSPCACKEEGKECATNHLMPMVTRHSIILNRDVTLIDLDQLCLNIRPAYVTICEGKTEGVFQFEPRGITEFAKSYAPTIFDDLFYITSLYRPGAMDCHLDKDGMPIDPDLHPFEYQKARGAHVRFVERRHGRDKVTVPAPQLKEILGPSQGIAVFQEDISRIVMKMTGGTFAEAEVIRKYFTKVKPELLRTDLDTIAKVKKMEAEFVSASVKQGATNEDALAAWNTILPFARYGFNKAHAVSYSLISYQTAMFRALYPLEFLVGLLTYNDKEEKVVSYIRTAQKLDMVVRKPDINLSGQTFSIDKDNAIISGLDLIKGVGEKAASFIVVDRTANGSYTSLEDFLGRDIPWRTVNAKVLEALCLAGAFDSIAPNRGLCHAKIMVARNKKKKSDYQTESIDIFDEDDGLVKRGRKNLELVVDDWLPGFKLEGERTVFGFPFDDTLRKNLKQVKKYYSIFAKLAAARGKQATFGVIEDIYIKADKNGNNMAFISTVNLEGDKQRWVLFSSIYMEFGKKLLKNEPYFAFGKQDGDSFLIDGVETITHFIDMFNKAKGPESKPEDE